MAVQIVGVDFSGAATANATWVCRATLEEGLARLTVEDCYRLPRERDRAHQRLRVLLETLPKGAVAALDFPFSVPEEFAQFWQPTARTMPDLWRAAHETRYEEFRDLRDEFVASHREPLRRGDRHFSGPLSPLKMGGPNMLPMTFFGMQLLHQLWGSVERSFIIPPLADQGRNGPLLLESMPGVLLRRLGLPAQNYKTRNKTNRGRPERVRGEILSGLRALKRPTVSIPAEMELMCIDQHDCLDALVAAIGGALWALDKERFLHPGTGPESDTELYYARLEGWLYAPEEIQSVASSKPSRNDRRREGAVPNGHTQP